MAFGTSPAEQSSLGYTPEGPLPPLVFALASERIPFRISQGSQPMVPTGPVPFPPLICLGISPGEACRGSRGVLTHEHCNPAHGVAKELSGQFEPLGLCRTGLPGDEYSVLKRTKRKDQSWLLMSSLLLS